MDPEKEREIWRRVQRNDTLNAEETLLPQRLESDIQEQRRLSSHLLRTAGMLRGGERTVFQRMARDTASGADRLTTLHYLLTGRILRLRALPLPPKRPLPEELRSLYFSVRQSAKEMSALAGEFAEFSDLFREREQALIGAERKISAVLQGKIR